MPITPILAMTPAEILKTDPLPPRIAWMACHFSSRGPGLTDLPQSLPTGSLLVVDDWVPPERQKAEIILRQLSECAERFRCSHVLLDFQRPGCSETEALAKDLAEALPCPVIVSEPYARQLSCPVLLPPVPPSVALKDCLSFWKGREIWLELANNRETLLLTEDGCEVLPEETSEPSQSGFEDKGLHCHNQIRLTEKGAEFLLWRTQKDLEDLCREAEALGVAGFVGLYQELRPE